MECTNTTEPPQRAFAIDRICRLHRHITLLAVLMMVGFFQTGCLTLMDKRGVYEPITIESMPTGAEVHVRGIIMGGPASGATRYDKYLGPAPVTFQAEAKKHTTYYVTVKKDGYYPKEIIIENHGWQTTVKCLFSNVLTLFVGCSWVDLWTGSAWQYPQNQWNVTLLEAQGR